MQWEKKELRTQSTMAGVGAWQQGHEAATHMASTAREMDAGAQLTFAFLCSPGSELMEQCCL